MEPDEDPDDRVKLPLEPEEALRALLAVDPDAEPIDDENNGDGDPDEVPSEDTASGA